jgi:hypothetical protein
MYMERERAFIFMIGICSFQPLNLLSFFTIKLFILANAVPFPLNMAPVGKVKSGYQKMCEVKD